MYPVIFQIRSRIQQILQKLLPWIKRNESERSRSKYRGGLCQGTRLLGQRRLTLLL